MVVTSPSQAHVLWVTSEGAASTTVTTALRGANFEITEVGPGVPTELVTAADCIVTGHDPPTLDATATLDRIREVDSQIPVVVYAERPEGVLDAVSEDAFADYVARVPEVGPKLLVSRLRQLVPIGDGQIIDTFDLVSEPVAVFDPESLAVLAANDALLDRWGLEDADVTLEDLVVEPLGEAAHPSALVQRAAGVPQMAEWHCRRGERDWFRATVKVTVDADRERGYLVADAAASTESETYDESMREALLDHIPVAVYFKDRQGRLVAASDAMTDPFIESPEGKRMFTPEDVVGKTDFDLYPIESAQATVEDDRRVMESGQPIFNRLEHVQPPGGPPLWFSTSKAPWYDTEGRLLGTVGVTIEVTERERRKEELLRQNEHLEQFADAVSDDLRQPLSAAQRCLERYRDSGDESALDEAAEMYEQVDELIEEVLSFARRGIPIIDLEAVDLADVIDEAWRNVETTTAATLESTFDSHGIEADKAAALRLFENLLRNAVQHGDHDVTVRVGLLERSDFFVEDDGDLVPDAEREAIFDRGSDDDLERTGLGLSIVREIAEAHGWDIRVTESTIGGTRFEFTRISGVDLG